MKKVISLLTVLLTAMSFAVSVAAADYATPPSYVPSVGSSPSGVAQDIPASAVAESVTDGKVVDISRGSTTVPLATLKDIIAQNKDKQDAKLSFQSKAKGKEYTIEIPIDSIKNPRALNVNLDLKNVPAATLLVSGEKVRIPDGSLYIVPSMKGDFGMDLNISFPQTHFTTGFEGFDGASLVYVNLKTGEALLLTEFIPFNEDGSISITLQKASAYYLMPAKKPASNESEAVAPNPADDKKPASDDSPEDEDFDSDEDNSDNDDTPAAKPGSNGSSNGNSNNSNNNSNNSGNTDTSDSSANSGNTGSTNNNASQSSQSSTANNDANEKDPWWNSDSGELNPPTGTVLGGTTIATGAAIATIFSKKRRHHHRRRR